MAEARGRATGASSKAGVKLARGTHAHEAAGIVLSRLADVADENLPGTLEDLDTEFLHDLRVSVRRARSVLRELRGVHPTVELAHLREELRWVQALTGPVRDLDVQLLEWGELAAALPPGRVADLAPLHRLLSRRRAYAFRTLRRGLQARRFAEALVEWRTLAAGSPAPDAAADQPHAELPIEALAGDSIRSVYRRMVRDGLRIGDESPPEALHDLRKRGKELRYLLELFGTLFPGSVVKPTVSSLKGLQDVLGRFRDRDVQAEQLRGLADQLAAEPGGPAALMTLGLAVEALLADQSAAREDFAERFEVFASSRAACPHRGHLREARPVMKVVATYSIKGGVGKTSAAVNLAALAARDGRRTLLWDLDPQGAASFLLRVKPKVKGGGAKLVRGRRDPLDVLKGTDVEGLDLLPADFSYRHLDLVLDKSKQPLRGLGRVLAPLADGLRPGDPGLRAIDLARVGERLRRSRPAARTAGAVHALGPNVEQLYAFLAKQSGHAPARARVLLDGRPAQATPSRSRRLPARRVPGSGRDDRAVGQRGGADGPPAGAGGREPSGRPRRPGVRCAMGGGARRAGRGR